MTPIQICFFALYYVVVFGSVVLNVSVITITFVGRTTKTNHSTVFVACLAFADLVKGLCFQLTVVTANVYSGEETPVVLCAVINGSIHFSSLISGYTLLWISVTQYVAVCYPHFHSIWMKRQHSCFLAISVMWIMCISQTIVVFLVCVNNNESGYVSSCNYNNLFKDSGFVVYVCQISQFWCLLLAMFFLNGMLIQRIVRLTKSVGPTPMTSSNTGRIPLAVIEIPNMQEFSGILADRNDQNIPERNQNIVRETNTIDGRNPRQQYPTRRKYWKPYITLIALVLSFGVFMGPYFVYETILVLTVKAMERSEAQIRLARRLTIGIVANTVFNPFIYAFRMPVYRRFIEQKIFKTRF